MIGIDEVGRGAWAGPLLVGAVRLHTTISGLKDSKQLTAKKRAELASQIASNADIGYGWVSSTELDDYGLACALRIATERALVMIAPQPDEEIIIDGTINLAPQFENVRTLVKADQTIEAVSAASICAKVARDTYMAEQSKRYPKYNFVANVGYGTREHTEAIKQYGYCKLHRRSFSLPAINNKDNK